MSWITFDAEIAPIIALAAVLFAICVDLRLRVGRHRRRTRELRMCADLLDQHRSSLEEFITASDAPVRLKHALIAFSEVASDREEAHRVVAAMCSGARNTKAEAESSKALNKAVQELRAAQPELAVTFETAVASAISAMLFRWPETADMFREFITKAMVDSRKGADLFARAARSRVARTDDDQDEAMFGPIMPAH